MKVLFVHQRHGHYKEGQSTPYSQRSGSGRGMCRPVPTGDCCGKSMTTAVLMLIHNHVHTY
jgi:hypothetical protein